MSNCSCIYVAVDDFAKFYSIKIRKARKEYKCSECNRIIEIGEKYEYVRGLWEEGFNTYRTCLDCLSIRNEFFCDGWYYTSLHEYLLEHIRDTGGQISENCILKLTRGAKDIVFNMIDDLWRRNDTISR